MLSADLTAEEHESGNFDFLVKEAKKGHLEVNLRRQRPGDRALFQEAMRKEATSWLYADAVRAVSRHGVDPERLLKCRFVLTWKENIDGSRKPKARLVVLGFADPDITELRAEAPVASRRARQMLLGLTAQRKWKLEKS